MWVLPLSYTLPSASPYMRVIFHFVHGSLFSVLVVTTSRPILAVRPMVHSLDRIGALAFSFKTCPPLSQRMASWLKLELANCFPG